MWTSIRNQGGLIWQKVDLFGDFDTVADPGGGGLPPWTFFLLVRAPPPQEFLDPPLSYLTLVSGPLQKN